jgi:hypothetical protein
MGYLDAQWRREPQGSEAAETTCAQYSPEEPPLTYRGRAKAT